MNQSCNFKGIPKWKTNFEPLKCMNILRCKAFEEKKISRNFFCCFFQFWIIGPPGQGEVRQGSRRSASGVKEKCVSGQGKVRQGQGEVLHLNTTHSAEALLLDFWCTFPWPLTNFSLTLDALLLDPWRTFPRPLMHFSLTWRAYLSELKKAKNKERKIQNYFGKRSISWNIHTD